MSYFTTEFSFGTLKSGNLAPAPAHAQTSSNTVKERLSTRFDFLISQYIRGPPTKSCCFSFSAMYSFHAIAGEVESLTQKAILSNLENKRYNHKHVAALTDQLNDSVLNDCQRLCGNLKYIVQTLILQNDDFEEGKEESAGLKKGLHLGGCALTDSETDGTVTVQWTNETMTAVVNVFGILI